VGVKQKVKNALPLRTFIGKDGNTYLVFRTASNSFHAFVEVEAKEAARQCGATRGSNTRRMWESVWGE
jgi:hypothetical protein